ncbi:MAG TPA: ABC transporter permease [Polyangiaceae bacterium]|nr:ABC transporter permease [Polyangiaceae bacterium]
MGFPIDLALRYMRSKRRGFVSVGTAFAVIGVALGVCALTTVIAVTGGFRKEFRDKVLGVNAHVLILKYSSDFREYRDLIEKMKGVPGVTGIAPFVINPMMVTHADRTATGVLLKGVDPQRVSQVLDLPRHIVKGSLEGLRLPGANPPERRRSRFSSGSSDKARDKSVGSTLDSPPAAEIGGSLPPQEPKPFLQQLAQEIAEDEIRDAPADTQAVAPTDLGDELPADAPRGSIVPEGGYESTLPDDDLLPVTENPDPCSVKEALLPGIVIGAGLAKNLNVGIGGCVQVTSPTIGFTYIRGAIRAPVAKQFRVIAIFDAGFDQYDSKLVYTDLYEAQAFYDTGDSVTGIEMKVADTDRAKEIAADIEERLSNGIYHTMDWEELNHGLFTALRIQQIMMSLILALIIVVAAFTVLATLIIVVLDKRKEIAVLKAMGATNSAILRAFIYQGGIIGAFGTALGLALGYGACMALTTYRFPLDPKVYFISKLPVQLEWSAFMLVGAFAIVVCLAGSFWPALHAATLRPAEAFREQ